MCWVKKTMNTKWLKELISDSRELSVDKQKVTFLIAFLLLTTSDVRVV